MRDDWRGDERVVKVTVPTDLSNFNNDCVVVRQHEQNITCAATMDAPDRAALLPSPA